MTQSGSAQQLVAGRYRLEERVGAGAMGVVWRAVDERLGRAVAVKELIVPPSLDPATAELAKQRLMREGRIAARVHHHNAIAVLDVADHEGSPWLVMEYLSSRSLATELNERGPLPPREVALIGAKLASALAVAHAAGIVHRDVKPGNVLLGEDGVVKLTDFGISRAVDDVTLTQTGIIAGTPAYLAPEVARGADPAATADVFALGATLYAAVEGEPPFGLGDNPIALLHHVASGAVRPPRQAGPLTATLMRLLRAEPADRPTMAQARGLLAACADGGTPAAGAAGLAGAAGALAMAPRPDQTAALPPTSGGQPDGSTVAQPAQPAQPTPGSTGPATRVGLPPIERTTPEGPRRRLIASIAAGAILAVIAGLLVVAATRGGTDPDQTAAGPNTEPTTSTPTPTPTTPTPTPTPEAPEQPDVPPPSSRDMERMVTKYYGLLPDRLDEAWLWIGPNLGAIGFDSYRDFWQRFRSVRSEVLRADPTTMRVRVVVSYREGRDWFAEEHELTLIQRDGELLIDGDEFLRTVPANGDNGDNDNDEDDEDDD